MPPTSVAELGDPTVVAIASDARGAAAPAGRPRRTNVGDHPEAYTRFAALASYTRLDRRHGAWRTAFSFVTDHARGAAAGDRAAREPWHRHGAARLAADPATPWSYRFDCVLGGHPLDDDVAGALARCASETARLRVFGSYRADLEDGRGAATHGSRRRERARLLRRRRRGTGSRTSRTCSLPRCAPSSRTDSPPPGCRASRSRASSATISCRRWRAPRRSSRAARPRQDVASRVSCSTSAATSGCARTALDEVHVSFAVTETFQQRNAGELGRRGARASRLRWSSARERTGGARP